MSTRRLFALAAIGSLFAVQSAQAWTWSWGNGERVSGNGELVSETRELGAFDGVSTSGEFNIVIRQGATLKVEVRTDKNLQSYLETKIVEGSKGRTLEVSAKRGFYLAGTVTPVLTLTMPTLRAVAVAGSGNVKVEAMKSPSVDASIAGSGDIQFAAIDTDKLGLRVSGSGDILANGRAGMATLSIAGSGDIKAAGLVADEVKVSIAGSGDAQVQAVKKLNVSVAGSGDVRYVGSPEISSSIAGSGSVRRMKE